jgi:hypothetical protein
MPKTPPVEPPAAEPISGDPFLRLPGEIELPPRGAGSTLEDREKTDDASVLEVGAVGNVDPQRLELRIDDAIADLKNEQRFVLTRAPRFAEPVWAIQLIPRAEKPAEAAADGARTVAYLKLDQNRLLFAWNPRSQDPLGGQLRNCVLHLSDGLYTHALRLRPVPRETASALDFDQERTVVAVDCAPLPARDQIYLEVVSLDGFDGDWHLDPTEGRVPLGEQLNIEHASPKVSIALEFEASETGLQVAIVPRYELSSRTDAFTAEQVRTTLVGLNKTLQENLRDLKVAQAAGQGIANRIRQIQSLPIPSGAQSRAIMYQRQAQVGQLQGGLKRAVSKARRLTNSIPRTKEALEGVKELATLGEQLRGQARIRFRIVAQSGERGVVLYDASR